MTSPQSELQVVPTMLNLLDGISSVRIYTPKVLSLAVHDSIYLDLHLYLFLYLYHYCHR